MKRFFFVFCLVIFSCYACKNKKQPIEKPSYTTPKSVELSPKEQSINRGKRLYTQQCVQCHQPHGKGIPKLYPPLRKSNWLTEKRKESIHAVKYGLQGEITVSGQAYDNIMLPLGLTDQEVADALNYVMNAWGNQENQPVTEEEVAAIKE